MSEEPRKKKAKVENSENLKVDFAIFVNCQWKRGQNIHFFLKKISALFYFSSGATWSEMV
jgi:hypothetical protein